VDVLSTLGLDASNTRPAVVQTRTRFKHLAMPETLLDKVRVDRAKLSISKLARCLAADDASDCILLAHPCVRIFQQMTHYSGGSLGELSCPVLLPSEMSAPQSLAVAEHALGAETYFEWGGGSSTEMLAPLAARAYTAEHYLPWCRCLRSRPIAKCLSQQAPAKAATDRITCVRTKLDLKSFGRLQQNGANNTHKNIADAHRDYVAAIDATWRVGVAR